jgi:hypothetical protein
MSAVIHTVLRMPACLMKASRIGDLDLAAARSAVALRDRVAAHHADRQIRGDDFPRRCERINSRLSQASCVAPRIAAAAPSAP